MKNPFIKYIMKDKKEDIFHSSAYGKVQSGRTIGSASAEGFEKRMEVDKNRQVVRGYGDSQIIGETYKGGPKAKEYVPTEKNKQKDLKRAEVTKRPELNTPKTTAVSARVEKTFKPSIKPNFGK